MKSDHNTIRRNSQTGSLEVANTMVAAVGMAPCADITTLMAQVEAQIGARQAELGRLVIVRKALSRLAPRSLSLWSPRPGSVDARVFAVFREGVALTRPQVAEGVSADGGRAVPYGSISSALSRLGRKGWIVRDGGGGWRPANAS